MANKVFLNDEGIIEILYIGDQTKDTAGEYLSKVEKLIARVRDKGKPVLILGSLEKIGKSSSESRLQAAKALKEYDYDKVALYGGRTYISYLANFIIKASGKVEESKLFEDRDLAEAWLRKNNG